MLLVVRTYFWLLMVLPWAALAQPLHFSVTPTQSTNLRTPFFIVAEKIDFSATTGEIKDLMLDRYGLSGVEITVAKTLFIGPVAHVSYHVRKWGRRIEGVHIRAHWLGNELLHINGQLDDTLPEVVIGNLEGALSSTTNWRTMLARIVAVDPREIQNIEALWLAYEGRIVAAQKFIMSGQAMTYIEEERQLLRVEKPRCHLDGNAIYAQVYRVNRRLTPNSSRVILTELNASGRLQSQHVRVFSRASEAKAFSGGFEFAIGDPRFDEANTYYHATSILAWFRDHGSTSLPRLTFYIHDHPDVAEYLPTDNSVTLGVDGIVLENLALDRDVIAHETGHHMIYNFGGLHTFKEESGALHEGLADYFAYAISGDPYLAESVAVGKPFLRSARNEIHYPSNQMNADDGRVDVYEGGRFIAAILWQMRARIDDDHFDRLVVNALPFLHKAAGFDDFANALLLSDLSHFEGRYKCEVAETLVDRGLSFSTTRVHVDDCRPALSSINILNGITRSIYEKTRTIRENRDNFSPEVVTSEANGDRAHIDTSTPVQRSCSIRARNKSSSVLSFMLLFLMCYFFRFRKDRYGT